MNEQKLLMSIIDTDVVLKFYVDLAVYLADLSILFFFAHRIFHKKKYSFIAVNFCAVFGALLFAFIGTRAAYFPLLGVFRNSGSLLFSIISLCILYKDKPVYKTVYALLCGLIFTLSDIFVVKLFQVLDIGHKAFYYSRDIGGTFCTLLCVTLRVVNLVSVALAYRMLKRFAAVGYKKDWAMLNYFAIILFVGGQLFGIFAQEYSHATDQIVYGIYAVSAALLFVGLVFLLRFFPKISRIFRTDESGADMSFEAASPKSDGLSAREMQKLRHDVKNNVATISALIDSGDPAEAKRLLAELGERLGSALGGDNKTGISAIDTALFEKEKLCRERGISLDMHVEPLPETKIPPIDLSSVIANIFDNAIEATEKCPEPVITLRIFKYKMYLAIVCENPTASAPHVINGALATTKEGGGHGYGVEIINEICKNNNGRFQYEFDDKIFKASAFLEL